MRSTMKGIVAFATLAMLATGCQTKNKMCKSDDKCETTSAKGVMSSDMAPKASAPGVASGVATGRLFYPTGSEATSALMLEKSQPSEVIAGKAFEYELKVKNLTGGKLENVEITESVPAGLKLGDKLDGAALRAADGKAMIGIGTLEAGETKVIKVPATATGGGVSTSCASISYTTSLCLGLNVVSPSLKLEKMLPPEILVCNTVPMELKITNTGTGTARNIKLEDMLPEGMTTIDGKNSFGVTLGDIAAGETKNVKVPLKLSKTGTYTNTAKVTGDDGLAHEASATVTARKPSLRIEKTGPKQVFIGREFNYDIVVTNTGDAPASDTVITDVLPEGLVAVSATDGATVTAGKAVWNIGVLDKGASRKLGLVVRAEGMTNAKNTVTATAACADAASVSAETALVGIPAILLEVVDSPDPVAVDGQTTYTIVVTNQGSALGTNIKIVTTLEPEMEFVSAAGVTNGKLDGAVVTFEPLASLAPKAKAAYTVTVKAKSENDVRFKVSMTSDQIKRPVEETESTNFYK
jgi:uncharacterized repeat protein (TIGR01451 family)